MKMAVMILAAGRSTRFRSTLPKVLHPLGGRTLLAHVVATVAALKPVGTVVVCAPDHRTSVRTACAEFLKVRWAMQRQARGTADAVKSGLAQIPVGATHVVILAGDVPLITVATLRTFVKFAQAAPCGAVLTMRQADPAGYGRVICNSAREVARIVEARDAQGGERLVQEVNTGVWCVPVRWLKTALRAIRPTNAQGEYYLTDIVLTAMQHGTPIRALLAPDATEFDGVNTRADLAHVAATWRRRQIARWMERGVTFEQPDSCSVDADVTIGQDTTIATNVTLRGATAIGANCRIDVGCVLTDATLADGVHLKPYSVLESSVVGADCVIGPFARLRPGTRLAADVHIGNFVETKQAVLARGVKANHLTYLGDVTIGESTNVGCGTITCNYDGVHKHPTTIGKRVFVGSDTAFVAPVKIGDDATIAAGSVITDDVPAKSLAIARGRQVVKRGWKRK